MKGTKFLKGTAVALACIGTTVPQCRVWAAAPKDAAPPAARSQPVQATDVALGEGGTVQGQVLDSQGRFIEGAVVSIRQGTKEVARTVTNDAGVFRVTNLQGGLYQVAAGNSQTAYRFWAPKTAPPAARQGVLVVSNPNRVVRGQGGILGVDVITLGLLGMAGTAMGFAIGAYESSDANGDQLNTIQKRLNEHINAASP